MFSFYACANQIIYEKTETLDTPSTPSVTAQAGKKFSISYTVENDEDTFIGYNLYVSTSSISDSDVSSLLPVSDNGNIPTVSHQKDEEGQSEQYVVSAYREENGGFVIPMSFTAGKKYYFRLCAYSRLGKLSTPSTETSATALP